MLLGLLLISTVLGAGSVSMIDDHLVDIKNATLISVHSTAKSSHQLDLSGLGLRRLTNGSFAKATGIKILDLANNSITSLTGSIFSGLWKLEHLSLANNSINHFAGVFAGLRNLKTLDISGNPSKSLGPGVFQGLSKSINVIARGNSFKKISTDLFAMAAADQDDDEAEYDYEDQQDQHNDEAPKPGWASVIQTTPKLRVKVCIDQGQVMLMERVRRSEVLQAGCSLVKNDDCCSLYIDDLGIKGFDSGWYRVANNPETRISTITIKGNDIVRVTEELLNDLPASVRTVDLSRNKIRRLERSVIRNNHINFLYLSNNSISVIEEGALTGMKLWQLNLAGNRLTDTKFLATLPPGLTKLFLHRNRIEDFTNEPLVNFYRLSDLDLSGNRITSLRSNSLRGLPFLVKLDLSRNLIEHLEPGCFKAVKTLRFLGLGDNEIGDLDAGVFEDLPRLHRLGLGGNRLTRITGGFRKSLPDDLEVLELDRNEIGSLENGTLVNVPKRLLNLSSNRITTIAKGSFVVAQLYGEDLTHEPLDESDILGPLFAGNQLAELLAGASGLPLPTKRKGIGSVDLSGNPLRKLENGALFGIRKGTDNYVHVARNSIELIQGGLFDDGNA